MIKIKPQAAIGLGLLVGVVLTAVAVLSSGYAIGPSICDVLDSDAARDRAQIAPSLQIRIDPRVEIMSIIYYLSGTYKEYTSGRVPSYVNAVETHFGAYRDHPAVKYVREPFALWGYHRPMVLAVFLTDAASLEKRVPFTHPIPYDLAHSWHFMGLGRAQKLAKLTADFSKDTNCESFFDGQQPLFSETLRRAQARFDEANIQQWCADYFGEGHDLEFYLVLGMMNGPYSYGGQVCFNDTREIYSFLGVWATDEAGTPVFSERVPETVLHEFAHAYVNPLVDLHDHTLRKSGKKLFARVRKQMTASAYATWRHMVRESIIRAVVIRYELKTRGPEVAKRSIIIEEQKGFFFIEELVQTLGEYETHRDKYLTFRSFAPRIVEFFQTYEIEASSE